MVEEIAFAINRMVSPQKPLDAFLELARRAGVKGVEMRNDVAGQEFADGTTATELKQRISDAGLSVASINALQRFNDWTADREREAVELIRYAGDIGAPGLVLCPVVEFGHSWSEVECATKLRGALRKLRPILADHGVIGYVEPLGMLDSTLRCQAFAVEAVGDIDGFGTFEFCYDTFQYYRASDSGFFPQHVGLVHVSGIVRTDLARTALSEPDRGLVDARDIAENVEQLKRLRAAGYAGYVSIEPFNLDVQQDPELETALRESLAYIRAAVAL